MHPPIRMDSLVHHHLSALQAEHLCRLMQQIGSAQRASPNDRDKQVTAMCRLMPGLVAMGFKQ